MQFPPDLLQRCWFLAGPTASGKSQLALELAEELGAEILSLDSMAIYRGMDIGTAKPSVADRQQIAHHLIDLVDPHEDFSVAEYVEVARDSAAQVVERGHVPLFVGGTGLYLRAVLRGVFEGPAADWTLRKSLQEFAELHGADALHGRLQKLDPDTAQRLHANDLRRVIRAIEVVEVTGAPLSAQQQQHPLPPDQRPRHVYWLDPHREWLYERINRRVVQMIDMGLVGEVESLLQRTPPISRTARQGLGYKEVIEHLNGVLSLPECLESIQVRTRQFAKRQHTWFRNLVECHSIALGPETSSTDLLRQLLASSKARS